MLRGGGTAAVFLYLVACNQSGSSSPPAPGAPADCTKVAEIVTNFELGTNAKPETRTPIVAKNREACQAASLTVAEANCIAKATSTWETLDCAPRMFPQRATGTDCKAVAGRMRDAITADMPKEIGSAGVAMVDKMMVVVEQSCRDDNWPDAFRTCVLATKSGDTAALQGCDDKFPQDLQKRMGDRLKPIINPPEVAPAAPAPAPSAPPAK